MEDYRMIISGIIGSVITLICTAIIDLFKEKYKSNVELKKMVFQRQTDAAEKAMSWLQESLDCFRMLQFACAEINENLNPLAFRKLSNTSKQADKLSSEHILG